MSSIPELHKKYKPRYLTFDTQEIWFPFSMILHLSGLDILNAISWLFKGLNLISHLCSTLLQMSSMGTLKTHCNRPLYSNTVTGTLDVDGWAVTFGTARRGQGGLWFPPVPSLLNQMYHPSMVNILTSYYSMRQYHHHCTLKD